jgi:hypothetical protein
VKSAADLLQADLARSERAAGARALAVVSREAPPAGVARSFGASGPGWLFDQPLATEGGSSARLTAPYVQSPWVMRAIQLKQGEIAAAPVKFYDGDEEVTDPAFLAWWAKPFLGPGQARLTLDEVRSAKVGWLDHEGDAFILLGDDWLVSFPELRGSKLSPPILARSDRMRHIVDAGKLIGWEFSDGAGRRWPLLPEQVIQDKFWNPYDDFRGAAPLDAVLTAAESDYLAGIYVRNLMRNNGDQGVYVIAKNGIPTDDQRLQIVRDLRAKRVAAQRGDFRPVFLTGDITIEDAKAQAPNADLNNTRLHDRHTVFIGLGVPASMADVQASYSVGSDSDRFRLITGTCQPLASKIDAAFGVIASRMLGRPITAEADWDEHPVVQEVRRQRIEAAIKLWGTGWSWKVINSYLDLGMEPFPGWEIPYLPFSVVPANSPEATPEKDPALAEVDQEDSSLQRLRLALAGRKRIRCVREASAAPAAHVCSCAPLGELFGPVPKDRDAGEVARWREYMRGRREHIAGFRSRFSRWLTDQRRTILANIDALGSLQGKSVRRAAAADLLFKVADATAELVASMRKQHTLALNDAGEEVFKELQRDDPFQFAPAKVLSFVKGRENKIAGVAEDTFKRLSRTLQEGLDAGESTEELAARIRSECNAIDKGRSNVIAQTETAAAFGYGRNEAMREAGVARKAWLTSGNDNVRDSHKDAGKKYSVAKAIPLDEPFIVGGHALQYPGDSSGPTEEIINCHCVQVAVAAKKEGDA